MKNLVIPVFYTTFARRKPKQKKMKHFLILAFAMMTLLTVNAKVANVNKIAYPGGKCLLYRIGLKDKAYSSFSLKHPEAFLSARSLERRRRQHIILDSTDLPVSSAYIKQVEARGVEVIGKSKWNNTLLVRVSNQRALKKLDGLTFVKYMMKVFSAPDSVFERSRSGYRKELEEIAESSDDEYGATCKQIENLNGRKLHQRGYCGEGKMIAVFDGGFMNADRIPALHSIKLAGIMDFVVPHSENIFQEMD